jgi:A118 family predicted phage portal protein
MFERLKNWIRGLTMRNKIEQFTDTISGDRMETAQKIWADAFYNTPAWCEPFKWRTTKFPGIVTGRIATLCTSEMKLSSGDSERAKWIDEQLQRFILNDIRNIIQKAAALSYVVLKPYIYGNNVACEVSRPGMFYPEDIVGGMVVSGVFVDEKSIRNGNREQKYVRLEKHQMTPDGVRITNKAYINDGMSAGKEVPLSTVPEWANLAPEVIYHNLDRPLFSVLAMPFTNQIDPNSRLPVSIYANSMDAFEKIDRIYNDFLWEVESGRRKQIFDITAVQATESPKAFDPQKYETTDQFILLNMGDRSAPYGDYTPALRIAEYQSAIDVQVRLLEAQIGVSAGTFNFNIQTGTAPQTATEILHNSTETFNTIKAIQEGMRQGLENLIYIYDTYATIYGLAPAGGITPVLEFGDSVFEDTATEFLRRKALADAGYLKPEELLSWYFAVTPEQAAEMIPAVQTGSMLFGAEQDAGNNGGGNTLNGAQTTALVTVVGQYAAGTLTLGQAAGIVSKSIGVSIEEAKTLIEGMV